MGEATQEEVLDQIDRQSRRALNGEVQADLDAILQMYEDAERDLEATIRSTLTELQATRRADRRQYLDWKLARERAFADQVGRRIGQLRDAINQRLYRGLVRQYLAQGSWDAYALDQATPPSIDVDARAVTPEVAEAITATPWRAAMFSDYVWHMTDDLAREIQQQIGQSVLLGEGVPDAVRRLRQIQIADGNLPPRYALERLVRTEMLKASDRARQQLYDANDDVVDEEVVVVALDARTCEICGPLDGKALDSREVRDHLAEEEAAARPPFHPNCRCTTMAQLKSWSSLLGIGEAPEDLEAFGTSGRVIRDPVTGKSRIASVLSYDEWRRFYGSSRGLAA